MDNPRIAEIVRRDRRYAYEAYEFVQQAVEHTQEGLGRGSGATAGPEPGPEHHITGRELLDGVRELALREFGRMARIVFRRWGIDATADVGEIVFNLVEAGLIFQSDDDERDDFRDVYDLDRALLQNYEIPVGEPEGGR